MHVFFVHVTRISSAIRNRLRRFEISISDSPISNNICFACEVTKCRFFFNRNIIFSRLCCTEPIVFPFALFSAFVTWSYSFFCAHPSFGNHKFTSSECDQIGLKRRNATANTRSGHLQKRIQFKSISCAFDWCIIERVNSEWIFNSTPFIWIPHTVNIT